MIPGTSCAKASLLCDLPWHEELAEGLDADALTLFDGLQ